EVVDIVIMEPSNLPVEYKEQFVEVVDMEIYGEESKMLAEIKDISAEVVDIEIYGDESTLPVENYAEEKMVFSENISGQPEQALTDKKIDDPSENMEKIKMKSFSELNVELVVVVNFHLGLREPSPLKSTAFQGGKFVKNYLYEDVHVVILDYIYFTAGMVEVS